MTLGFKTGPKNFAEGKRIVLEDDARMCELWFNVSDLGAYDEILPWLRDHSVAIGLHHWGVVEGTFMTNLMTEHAPIRTSTIGQIRRTIDIASDIGAVYVNVHPGAQSVTTIDFKTHSQRMVSDIPETPQAKSETLLAEAARELDAYAQSKNVLLTFETLPAREPVDYLEREGRFNPKSATLDLLLRLGERGQYLANDLTHTAAQFAVESSDPEVISEKLLEFTKAAAPFTRLLHVNTVGPPHDGTDSHGGITPADFQPDVLPTRPQLKQMLALFVGRGDTYVVPEPRENMQDNFRALRQIVDEI